MAPPTSRPQRTTVRQPTRPVIGLLLAAGYARRYGGEKLLEPLPYNLPHADRGIPVALAAAQSLKSACDLVLAVVRPGSPASVLLGHHGIALVPVATEPEPGLGDSLATGIRRSLAFNPQGWLVTLADMPFIHPDTPRAVATALRQGASIAAPVYQGQRGHPVAFARHLEPSLSALHGEQGARHLLMQPDTRLVEVDDPGCLVDLDRSEDWPRNWPGRAA